MIMRKSWKKDKHGDMGVGTMIIFIAMVLVAAVAASVLISTANTVREQAQNTGNQAIINVASGFVIQSVTGTVGDNYSHINILTIQMRLQAGSPSINMDQVSIQVVTGSSMPTYSFANGTSGASSDKYGATSTGSASTWTTGNHVVQQGDLVTVTIGSDSAKLDLGYSASATVKIVPAYGSSTLSTFVTPSFYDTTYVSLK